MIDDFLRIFLDTVRMEPDRPALVDLDGKRVTSYRELCSCAYRVNAWIRAHGLGRESVSAIYLPRGMEYIATRIGIMMAGSAWVGLEDLMGKERINFVIRDSGCKTVFDKEKWEEAMQYDECQEIEEVDLHDLAFVIYTSGSTGKPKAILQEYGVYDLAVEWAQNAFMNRSDIIFGDVVPQTFITGVMITISILSEKGTLHEISYETTRNIKALTEYFIKEKITDSFLTPSLLRLFINRKDLYLRNVIAGGELASELYSEQFEIRNIYGSSEVGYPALMFLIDKAYIYTPVGSPICGADVVLLDENNMPSDEGELCITIPYFRGYIGDDRECFITMNGKRFFRTNDYAQRDTAGRYTILDRLDNMVKINGNRVDLHEVEITVKSVLHLDSCCVKLFMNNGIKLLCAYYTGKDKIENTLAAEELRKHIPEYMIPGLYMRLDRFPINSNGKIDKFALPEPDLALRIVPYCAPQDSVQEMLCSTMKKVLELTEDVGIDEDFFSLGGDSVCAMEVLESCDIPGLSVQMIYEGRTVRQITELLNKTEIKDVTEGEEFSLAPLSIGQLYLLRTDLK